MSVSNILINPLTGHLLLKVYSFADGSAFDHIQRPGYYTLILLTSGSGQLKSDFTTYDISAPCLLSFAPYQPFMIAESGTLHGAVINFHPDFFCIHKNQEEVACNGVLFNNIFQPPFTILDHTAVSSLLSLTEQLGTGIGDRSVAQNELLVSYLKIFLITASRIRIQLHADMAPAPDTKKQPFVLQSLRDAIEQHYRTVHSPGGYADMLNISSKALARITKIHFHKTLSHLISERIVIEAKRELYLTSKPVKTIASELGFHDEYYFSRFFQKQCRHISSDVSRYDRICAWRGMILHAGKRKAPAYAGAF